LIKSKICRFCHKEFYPKNGHAINRDHCYKEECLVACKEFWAKRRREYQRVRYDIKPSANYDNKFIGKKINWKFIVDKLGYKSEMEMAKDLYLNLNKFTDDISCLIELECNFTVSSVTIACWLRKIFNTKTLLPKINLIAKYLGKTDVKSFLEREYKKAGGLRVLGETLSMDPWNLSYHMKKMGIKMRPRGGNNRR